MTRKKLSVFNHKKKMIVNFNCFLQIVAPLLLLRESYITFSAEQISPMQFHYVQDVCHKNQLGT